MKNKLELQKIEDKLNGSYDERRAKQEQEAIKKIKRDPIAFYSYAKRFSQVRTGVGPLNDEPGDLYNG